MAVCFNNEGGVNAKKQRPAPVKSLFADRILFLVCQPGVVVLKVSPSSRFTPKKVDVTLSYEKG